MANFTKKWPAGIPGNGPLASALMQLVDEDLTKAVNGDEGGSYAGNITFSGLLTVARFAFSTLFLEQDALQIIEKKKRTGTGANNGDSLRIRAQTGQDQSGGSNNNNGGVLILEAGAPGTGGGGTAGKRGYLAKQWAGGISTLYEFGDEFTVAAAGGSKVCSFVLNPPPGTCGWILTTAVVRDTDNNEMQLIRRRERFKKSAGGTLTLAGGTNEAYEGDFGTEPTIVHLNTSNTIEVQANNAGTNDNLEWSIYTQIYHGQ